MLATLRGQCARSLRVAQGLTARTTLLRACSTVAPTAAASHGEFLADEDSDMMTEREPELEVEQEDLSALRQVRELKKKHGSGFIYDLPRQKDPMAIGRGHCVWCSLNDDAQIHYMNPALSLFLTPRFTIVPRKISHNCAKHQRLVARTIKRARNIAVLPFTSAHKLRKTVRRPDDEGGYFNAMLDMEGDYAALRQAQEEHADVVVDQLDAKQILGQPASYAPRLYARVGFTAQPFEEVEDLGKQLDDRLFGAAPTQVMDGTAPVQQSSVLGTQATSTRGAKDVADEASDQEVARLTDSEMEASTAPAKPAERKPVKQNRDALLAARARGPRKPRRPQAEGAEEKPKVPASEE